MKRLHLCQRAPLGKEVEVWQSQNTGLANYHKVMMCGLVWVCPVCSQKISDQRREELQQALKLNASTEYGYTWFLTLTIRHSKFDDLDDLLKRLKKAQQYFFGGRAWMEIKRKAGLVGTIVALEVTVGPNGWHPHLHILGFTQDQPAYHYMADFLDHLEGTFRKRWGDACERAGLPRPSDRHGVDLRDGQAAAEYVGKFGDVDENTQQRKWDASDEMTKSHSKRGREGNRTPWDLLRDIGDGDDPVAIERDTALFQEYARCFKGRRQLRWSPGLRDTLGMGKEATDEDIAEKLEDRSILLGRLSLREWKVIIARDDQCLVLEIAETLGWSGVEDYLDSIPDKQLWVRVKHAETYG